jgi:serine protease Do
VHSLCCHSARGLRRACSAWGGLIVASITLGFGFAAQSVPAKHGPESLVEMSSQMRALSQQVAPSVVQVLVSGYGLVDSESSHPVSLLGREKSIGSGVIVDPEGYIVTNAHVIEGAVTIRVVVAAASLPDELADDPDNLRTVDAKIIGVDQDSDLAVLKIEGKGLQTLQFMNSDRLRQGDLVLAIGAPMGLRNSVSFGVVSSPDRSVGEDHRRVYIQTDASINPGNSGGALVTMDGQLAGLNTFIVSQSGGNEGLGFAIPSNAIRDVYHQLRKQGRVSRGEIGIYVQDITFVMAKGLSLARDHGVIVADILPDGPAEHAGLKRRDIILALDGQRIASAGQLENHIYRRPAGDKLELQVLRGQTELMEIVPVVRERQDKSNLLAHLVHPERNLIARLGILCIEIDKELAALIPDLRREYGLIVAGKTAGGQSQSIDLQAGDIIDAVNNSPVALLDSFRSTLSQMQPGDPVVLQIERDGRFQYLAFELDR